MSLDSQQPILLRPLFFIGAMVFFLLSGTAATDEPADCAACPARYGVPFIRIAFVETAMVVSAAVLWPEGYSPMYKERNWAQFKSSWSSYPEYHFTANPFASDNDWWTFNFFAHGLFGSEGYIAGRSYGFGPMGSLGVALFASFTWEYLVESFFKPPSAIDLFWTPLFGAILGELRYQAYRAATRHISNRYLKKSLQIVLDPFGVLERRIIECKVRLP